MKKEILLICVTCLSLLQLNAQVYTNKVVGPKNEAYIDSLKVSEYPYVLPIWGAKAAARGFDLLLKPDAIHWRPAVPVWFIKMFLTHITT